MTTPLTFFILSGFVMAYLILHKEMEIAFGRGLIMKNLLLKGDLWFHGLFSKIRKFVSLLTWRNLVIALNYLLVVVLRGIIAAGSFIRKKMTRTLDDLTYKQEKLTRSNAASAYLKQIAEEKRRREEMAGSPGDQSPEQGSD